MNQFLHSAWSAVGGVGRVALIVLFGSVGTAAAQAPEDEPDMDPAANAQNQFVWNDQQFEQWVFQQQVQGGPRRWFDTRLALQLEAVDRACRLTDGQKKKCQLAGHGDVKRFLDRYERVRQKFDRVKADQNKFNDLWQEIQPLQTSLQGDFFGEGSLFAKALPTVLTPEQQAKYAAAAEERRQFRHRASVALAVALIEKIMPLQETQRQKLTDLLQKETKPLRRAGAYEGYVLLVQLAKIPDEKLKTVFDDYQWKPLDNYLKRFKSMETWIAQWDQPVDEED